jgi:hypothetical protein
MGTRTSSTDALKMLFGLNYEVLKKNLEGIRHDDSLIQPQGGGNCLNWVIGHIVATRDGALQLLKQDPIWSQEETETYRRGSAPIRDGSRALSLRKLVSDLDRSQGRLIAGLTGASGTELSAAAGEQTVGETLLCCRCTKLITRGKRGCCVEWRAGRGQLNSAAGPFGYEIRDLRLLRTITCNSATVSARFAERRATVRKRTNRCAIPSGSARFVAGRSARMNTNPCRSKLTAAQ